MGNWVQNVTYSLFLVVVQRSSCNFRMQQMQSFQSIPRYSLLWEEEAKEGFWVIWIGHLSKRSYERSANSRFMSVKYMREVTRQGNFKKPVSRNIDNKNCKNLNWLSRW